MALYMTGEPPQGYADPEGVMWLRPEDLPMEGRPKFISGGIGSNDVKQGQIGDCWFIGALSVLATRDELLRGGLKNVEITPDLALDEDDAYEFTKGVYPPIFHMYRKKGLYVLRFFKDFCWRYVIVDERIPCHKHNCSPVFGKCSDLNELWVPLIEKAYAKLHGCYETLVSGFIDDALNDLTGLVSEKVKVHDNNGVFPHKNLKDKDTFWTFLLERDREGSMMGCSVTGDVEREVVIDGFKTGIMTGHAYGIIDVFELKDPDMANPRGTHRILRIRNPWGKLEWKGKWSD